jgi:hypothetical protein
MKLFFQRQLQILRDENLLKDAQRVLPWLISIFFFAYVLVVIAGQLYETAAPKGIVFATDNDGGRAIEVSMDTRWYKSNHFAPYGNFNYRLSHTLADLLPSPKENLSPLEQREYAHDLSLKMVSLFSLASLGFFLGWTLFGFAWILPLFSGLFLLLSTRHPLWTEWLNRPHPEHLLTLMVTIAFYFFARYLKHPESRRLFILSAVYWGLAMAVKRTTSIFIPGLLLVMLFPMSKASFKRTANYILVMLSAYLVIGFPQNFGFYKHIKFLLYESSLHKMADAESINYYLEIISEQLLILAPLIFISHFFSSSREKIYSNKLLIFFLISIVPVLARKMSFNGDHHTLLLTVSTLMMIMIVLIEFNPWRVRYYQLALLAVVLLISAKYLGFAPAVARYKHKEMKCRQEMYEIINTIEQKISSNRRLLKEPYFPFNENLSKLMTVEWGLSWPDITEEIQFLGIFTRSYRDYLEKESNEFYGKVPQGWDMKKAFYQQLKGQTEATSPDGKLFKKIKANPTCKYELWERSR